MTGGRAACQRPFEAVLARESGDFRYAREHRLTVDAFSLQHPDEYMRSAKSYAAHPTGMYAAFEDGPTVEINRAVRRWLDGPNALQRPGQPGPGQRRALTVVHVHEACEPEDHLRRVREWAPSTWKAWRAYRPLARQWIDEATSGRRAGQ